MLIAGWGKKGKEIAYFGIMKCGLCRNHSDHRLYEYSQRVTVYFVPVAKFNTKYYLVCDICDAAREMDRSRKDEVLGMTINIPRREDFYRLWQELTQLYEQTIVSVAEGRIHASELLNHLESSFKQRNQVILPDRQLDYVYSRFILLITDDDLPK